MTLWQVAQQMVSGHDGCTSPRLQLCAPPTCLLRADGETWGEIRVLFDANHSWPTSKFRSEHSNAIWDPTPLFDRTTGKTFVFFGGPGRTSTDSRLDVTMMSSTDLVSSHSPLAPTSLHTTSAASHTQLRV